MRNRNHLKWCAAVSLIAIAWLATSTHSYKACKAENRHAAEKAKAEKPKEIARRTVFDDLQVFVQCEGVVIDANDGLLTALATLAIAAFTIILADATRGLQRAARQQQRDTRRSLDIAAQSANTARDGLLKLQRAFVTHQGMRYLSHTNTDGTVWWSLHFNWHNSGASPAQKVRFHISRYFEDVDLPSGFDFAVPHDRPSVFMGPQSTMTSSGLFLTADELMAVRENKKFLYFWGRVDYRDIFDGTPDHVTKFAMHVRDFRGDPARVWDDKTNIVELVTNASPSRHNCADEGCT